MKYLIVAVSIILICSCQKSSDDTSLPSVQTSAIQSLTNTAAVAGGTIINVSTVPVTSKGVCWSQSQNPTIRDNKLESRTSNGTFTCEVTGLQPRITYHLRAFAIVSDNTVYGDEITFTTLDNDLLPVSVEPFLKTSWTVFTWPYNAYYPDFSGTNAIHGKYPAPCGPTSLARILAHWKGKIYGSGLVDAETTFGDTRFTVKLDTIKINYDNMPASFAGTITSSQYKDVAKMFLVAGSVGLTNFIDVGTPDDRIINGFKRYLNVSENVRLIKRWDYTKSEWIKLLKTELSAGHPLMIAARTPSSPAPGQPGNVAGHWFNIEGYNSEDKFYINYNYQGTGFKGYYDVDSFGEYCTYGIVVAGFEPRK